MIEKLSECAKHEFDKGIESVDTKEMGEVVDILKDLCEAEYYAKISKAMDESEYGKDYDVSGPIDERKYYRGQPRDSMGRFTSRGRGGRRGRMGFEMMPMPMPGEYQDEDDYWRQMEMMKGRMFFPDARYDDNVQWDYSGDTGRKYATQGSSSGGGSSQGGSRGGSQQGSNDGGTRGSQSSRYGYSHDEYMKEKQMNSGNDEASKKKRMEKLEEYMDDLGTMAKDMVHDMSPEEKQMWKVKLNKLINM